MRVLELFAGTRSIGRAFEARGHTVDSVDLNEKFDGCIHTDAYRYLEEHGEEYDVIWASPCCTTYSLAAIYLHRVKGDNGKFIEPVSDYARECDLNNARLFEWCQNHPDKIWFIENPRAEMQYMKFAQPLAHYKYTICYCKYGYFAMKPTNIWTNHPAPNFKPMCTPGNPDHYHSVWGLSGKIGSKKERGVIPDGLCQHIVDICESVETRH